MLKKGKLPCFRHRPLVVIMGVSGAGKSTIGAALARRENLPFLDADAYHPHANITKMAAGIPLADSDRWPWLSAYAAALRAAAREHGGVIGACSALKKSYRSHLLERLETPALFVLLDGDRALLMKRLSARQGHYMPPTLLDSQLAILEPPQPDEPFVTLSVDATADAITDELHVIISATGTEP